MIPKRIRLAGFLSYRDEQEVHFEGASLWMLSGANGSGKSSIFDAVTYALFGCHRGGSSQAAELVNKDSSTLDVEFDFTLDGQLYRIKRTLKKLASGNKSTVQIFHSPSDTGTDWVSIPETGSKKGFEEWIAQHVGLNFETFTSSVLLLQGKAEKLLDSTPSGRAGVLASIVDLERYQKLHAKADEQRKNRKAALEAQQNQLDAIREVNELEYALATQKIDDAEASRNEALGRIDALQVVEVQAGRWIELQSRLASVRERLASDEALLGHADAIVKQFNRFRELRDVLPAVGTIVTERGRVIESERRTEKLLTQQTEQTAARGTLEHDLATARQTLADLKTTLAADEAKAAALNTKLRELAGVIEQVRLVEDQQTELKGFEKELSRLPKDAEKRVRELQEKQEQLSLLAQALPSLVRIADERSALALAIQREAEAKTDEAKLLDDGKKAKLEQASSEAALLAARAEREAADTAAAEARALQQEAQRLAEEFKKLGGEKSCRACGQPLTPQHFAKEKKSREAALRTADKRLDETTVAAEEKRKAEADATAKDAKLKKKLDDLRERYRDRSNEVKQATQDIRRLSDSIRDAYLATPEPYRSKISADVPDDWTQVNFPSQAELTALKHEASQAEAARQHLREAQAAAANWQALNAKVQSARERFTKLEQALPAGDAVSLREKFTTSQSEETALANAIKAGKKAIQTTESDVDRLQRLLSETERGLVACEGELRNEENSRSQSHETIIRLGKGLPDPWKQAIESAGLAEQIRWKEEFEGLQAKDIEGRHSRLQGATGSLERSRDEIKEMEESAKSFPEEHRRSPDEIRQEITAARTSLDACDELLLAARQDRAVIDADRQRRAEVAAHIKEIEGEHNQFKILAELLGRDRLQRHLVRKAERQIIDYANAMLDRLSGGQLFLRIVDADTGADKALDLECLNRVTGASPINVAFISGSQRFRVAVSLALGIGQYASTQHRPIECVIIDEGFGCLDRNGRQMMIQELHNLRGHLRRILLVSHQEEFADAFPDGYRFELCDGTTRVSRREK